MLPWELPEHSKHLCKGRWHYLRCALIPQPVPWWFTCTQPSLQSTMYVQHWQEVNLCASGHWGLGRIATTAKLNVFWQIHSSVDPAIEPVSLPSQLVTVIRNVLNIYLLNTYPRCCPEAPQWIISLKLSNSITGTYLTQTPSVTETSNIYPSIHAQCIRYFSHCCGQVPGKKWVKEGWFGWFGLVLSLTVKSITEGKPWQQEHEQLVTLHTQSGSKDRWILCLAYSLLFIQSGVLALRIGGVHNWGGSSHFHYANLEVPPQTCPTICLSAKWL
jgi:hypothetical protein